MDFFEAALGRGGSTLDPDCEECPCRVGSGGGAGEGFCFFVAWTPPWMWPRLLDTPNMSGVLTRRHCKQYVNTCPFLCQCVLYKFFPHWDKYKRRWQSTKPERLHTSNAKTATYPSQKSTMIICLHVCTRMTSFVHCMHLVFSQRFR